MGVTDWFAGLSPEVKTALIMGGAQLGGGFLSGMGQGKNQEQQNQIEQQRNFLTARGQDFNLLNSAAQMQGNSPLQFQMQRQKMALMNALLSGRSMGGGVQAPSFLNGLTGKVSMPRFGAEDLAFSSPQAMANAEVPYWQAAQFLNPNATPPNLSSMGYGAAAGGAPTPGSADAQLMGNAQRVAALRGQQDAGYGLQQNALNNALRPPAPKGYEWGDNGGLKKKGGGFWKTLGKIGLGIGGGIATAMTGGAAAPLIGAAFGAGAGAIDGGWKGALMGAGTGALGGAFSGGATSAPMSFGKAVTSSLTNPRLLTQSAGYGIGGPVGTAMALGSNLLPTSFGGGSYVRNQVGDVANRAQQAASGGYDNSYVRNAVNGVQSQIQGGQQSGFNWRSLLQPIENALPGQSQMSPIPNASRQDWQQMIEPLLQQILLGRQGGGLSGFPGGGIGGWRRGGLSGNDPSAWTPPYAMSFGGYR